jgi:hypothetical protein
MAFNLTIRRRSVELARPLPVPLGDATDVLRYGADRLVAPDLAAPWAAGEGLSTVAVDLPGGLRLTRDVRIGFGPIFEEEDGSVAVPVWWEAEDHPQLFPSFDGAFEVRHGPLGSELCLVGSYQPPLGSVGRFADGVIGHQVVMASLEAVLTRAAERLAGLIADTVAADIAAF